MNYYKHTPRDLSLGNSIIFMESRNITTTTSGEDTVFSPLDRKANYSLTLSELTDDISPVNFPLYNLIPEIIADDNLEKSFKRVICNIKCSEPRHKDGKHTSVVIDGKEYTHRQARFVRKKNLILERIKREICNGTFRVRHLVSFETKDGPKIRTVQAPSVTERIACNAIMEVVEKNLTPLLIEHTASSIKGRGPHGLFESIVAMLDEDPSIKYYYQSDYKGYYDNIVHKLMIADIERYIQDPILLPMLRSFVKALYPDGEKGISKGLRSSQFFGNLYLNDTDHKMMSLPCVGGMYFRFCDDTYIFGRSKKDLWQARAALHKEAEALGLTIKPNERVSPISAGMDALGYVNFGTHSRLRKRTKVNAARKLAKVKSRKRRQEIIGSLKGMACHADCSNLFYKLTGKRMKKFSEMGVVYTPADGKKRFPGKACRLGALQNKTIEIHDYEVDMKTSQGENRYLVSFFDPQTKEWGKFFTASEEMKNILDQISDMEDGFPFETVIVSELFDGCKQKFSFT